MELTVKMNSIIIQNQSKKEKKKGKKG